MSNERRIVAATIHRAERIDGGLGYRYQWVEDGKELNPDDPWFTADDAEGMTYQEELERFGFSPRNSLKIWLANRGIVNE